MNTPSSSSVSAAKSERPRLICRTIRVLHSRQNDLSTDAGIVGRHRVSCAVCAEYFARASALESSLSREARAEIPAEIPAGLEDRIWAAVRPEVGARSAPARSGWSAGWRPVAMGALAVLALGVVWLAQRPTSSLGDESVVLAETVEFDEADMRGLIATIETHSTEWLTATVRAEASVRKPSVLEQELDALGSDARGALRFLERNFVPSTLRGRGETI
jgi:hypothetical protein